MKSKTIFNPTYTTYVTCSLFLSATGINGLYAQDASEDLKELESTVVVGDKEEATANPDFLKSLRFTDDLKNTPITTQVISAEVIEDLQSRKLEDILEHAGGVTPTNSFGNTEDGVSIRGFDANIVEDGIVTSGVSTSASFRQRNAATIESVEVVSGPQGALFGSGGLGGTVSIVTKQPKVGQFLRTRSTVSTEGLLRQDLDLNLSFGSTDQYRFRFITSLEDDDRDFRDRADGDSSFLRGMFQYAPNDDFKITLGVEHTNANSLFDRGVPIDLDGNLLTGRNVNLNPDGLGHIDTDNTVFDSKLEYRLSDNWNFQNTTRYEESSLQGDSFSQFGVFQTPVPLGLLNPNFAGQVILPFQTITRSPLSRAFGTELFTTRTELKGVFNTGSLSHESLISLEYTDSEIINRNALPTGGIFDAVRFAVDLENLNIDLPTLPTFIDVDALTTSTETFAIGAFDKITVNDSLNVVLGGRVDFVDNKVSSVSAGTVSDFSESEFSPTVGVNYSFNEQFSTYALYSESFLVNFPDVNGNVIDPREGKNIELGVRYNIPNTKLTLNASVFDIEETNRPTTDLSIAGALPESGTFESQGVDFKLQGEVNEHISIILNYVYNDTEFTETTNARALGSAERGIPEHQANLFVSYDFTPDEARGLTLNAGVIYVGDRLAAVPSTTLQFIPTGGSTLQDYIRVDVGARYNFGEHKSIGLQIENLFGEDYERQGGNPGVALPEPPRTAFVTFDWEF